MNAPAIKRMAAPEFLAWAETQEGGRHELVRGPIVSMAPELPHMYMPSGVSQTCLKLPVERAGLACEAFVDGLAVVIDDETRHLPDALVNCGEQIASNSLIAPHPVIVVEVRSPSTREIDKSIKLADYCRVACRSLYLIIDLGRRHVLHYRKQPDEGNHSRHRPGR